MPTTHDPKQQFTSLHQVGFAGLFNNYGGFRGILDSRPLKYAVFFGLIILGLLLYSNKPNEDLVDYLNFTTELGSAVVGGLIGLSLAGLTLVVTFGSGSFMKTIVKIYLEDAQETRLFEKSIYQSIVAKFSFAVFVQVTTLIAVIGFAIVSRIGLKTNESVAFFINYFAIFISITLLLYSLLLVAQMTINIFSLGQQNHLIYVDEVLSENSKKTEK